MIQEELKKIPGVDTLLNHPVIAPILKKYGPELITYSIRSILSEVRERILGGELIEKEEIITGSISELADSIAGEKLVSVINATGIVLHTNLGRAPLGDWVINEVEQVVSGYCNLEFDLKSGKRGHRMDHVVQLIKFITGAEDAAVVNNNAAGLLLTLNTLAKGKEVIISRGELIEIGDSFRIPDIMKASGVRMVELGTTNRTRIMDYEKAITSKTRIIFKAHKSNYSINGFTEEVAVKELADLAKRYNLLLIYDIGSGLLKKPDKLFLEGEPDVRTGLADGADILTFSCDKLLGGPQAGIVAGRKEFISKIVKAPLMRTLRVDKMTIAALSAVVRCYLKDEDLLSKIPVFKILNRKISDLNILAEKLQTLFNQQGITTEVIENDTYCGGGTLPNLKIKSYAVLLTPLKRDKKFAQYIFKNLLKMNYPVLSILREGNLLFEVLTLSENDLPYIVNNVKTLIENRK